MTEHKAKISALITLINVELEVLTSTIRKEKERKSKQIGRKKYNHPYFSDDTIVYKKPSKINFKKLELINEFNKFS